MLVITIFDVLSNVLCFSLLCWMYIAICNDGHYHVGCVLQCTMVVIIMLEVYCSVKCILLRCWMYIAMFYGGYYYVGCNIIYPT